MTGPIPEPEREAPRTTLTVAAVARRLGVAPATLRTWDRRYGLGPSEHQVGAHRRYSPSDIARLLTMRRLTLEGVAPAEAAAIARDTPVDPNDTASITVLSARLPARTRDGGDVDRSAQRLTGRSVDGTAPDTGHPLPGASAVRLVDAGVSERAARGLGRAATSLDVDECRRIIRRHLDREGTVLTWERVIAPVLAQLGDRWQAHGDSIEVEHLLSECVIDAMRAVTASVRPLSSARPVVLAAAENEQHGLPLHVLAAALAEQGIAVRLFGVRVPREALAAAVRRIGPAVVFIYAHLEVADTGSVADLPKLRPAPLVLLGGPGWAGVATPAGAERAPDLGGSVARIERALGW